MKTSGAALFFLILGVAMMYRLIGDMRAAGEIPATRENTVHRVGLIVLLGVCLGACGVGLVLALIMLIATLIQEGVMTYVLLILVLLAAIAELTIYLTYRDKINEYAALACQIEAAEKRIRDIDKVVPAYLTAADLEHVAYYIDLAFATQLYGIPGDDSEREDIIKAQHYAISAFRLLAAEREEKEIYGTSQEDCGD